MIPNRRIGLLLFVFTVLCGMRNCSEDYSSKQIRDLLDAAYGLMLAKNQELEDRAAIMETYRAIIARQQDRIVHLSREKQELLNKIHFIGKFY